MVVYKAEAGSRTANSLRLLASLTAPYAATST